MKISEEFKNFIHSPESGVHDTIADLSARVFKDDVEADIMCEEYADEYFFACMELAINVISSFETE